MSSSIQSSPSTESNALVQGTVQASGVLASAGQKLLNSRLKAPVRMGPGERDVFEAPIRVHSGIDGLSKALMQVEAPKTPTTKAGQALGRAKLLGRGLVGLGIGLDALDLGRSIRADQARADGQTTETRKSVGRIAGGWGGALAGAKAGVSLPVGNPILGMVVGSVVGGISGHIVGEKIASY